MNNKLSFLKKRKINLIGQTYSSFFNQLRSTANQKSALKKLSVICTMSWSLGIPWILGYFLLVDSDSTYQAVVGWLFVILLTLHVSEVLL